MRAAGANHDAQLVLGAALATQSYIMRKTTLGISLVALLGIAGTAAADRYDDDNCDHDGYSDDGYASDYDNYDNTSYDNTDYDGDFDEGYDYAGNGWVQPTVALPAPTTVVVDPRAGYVWVEGHWSWNGYDWTWSDGYWARTRSGYNYVQGTWQTHGNYRRWVAGRWQAQPRTRVIIQSNNHRGNGWGWRRGNRGNQGGGRIVVRDHRNDRGDRGNRGSWRRGRR